MWIFPWKWYIANVDLTETLLSENAQEDNYTCVFIPSRSIIDFQYAWHLKLRFSDETFLYSKLFLR